MKRLLIGVVAAMASTAALAHAGVPEDGGLETNDVAVALVIAALLLVFARGWTRMPRRRSGGRAVPSWRAALFVGGLLLLAAVLLPPFDELADSYFSAHMGQHLVLLLVAPPMLAASQAQLVLLHAFPLRLRRSFGRWIAGVPGLRFVAHHSSTIWFVCLSSVAVLWFWHLPQIYNWARRNEAVHDCEHLFFFLTELAFWRVILFRRERELSRFGAALILVAMSVQGGLLAAVITLAGRPMYTSYGSGPAALADQALGGVMMWVIADAVYLGAFAILFGQALARPRGVGRRGSSESRYLDVDCVPLGREKELAWDERSPVVAIHPTCAQPSAGSFKMWFERRSTDN